MQIKQQEHGEGVVAESRSAIGVSGDVIQFSPMSNRKADRSDERLVIHKELYQFSVLPGQQAHTVEKYKQIFKKLNKTEVIIVHQKMLDFEVMHISDVSLKIWTRRKFLKEIKKTCWKIFMSEK